jgi:ribosomal protein S18 acetylase RimI-like enzyme
MIGITYRHILERDVAAIAHVHRRACLIAYRFMNWSYSEDAVREWYAGKFASWDWGLVAEEKTVVVGFVATSGAHLDQLFVDPGYQKLGIGTSMLAAALQRMPALVTLTMFEANTPARRFYENHGFREAGSFFNENDRSVELVYRRDGNSN